DARDCQRDRPEKRGQLMNRRQFLRATVATVAARIVAPNLLASTTEQMMTRKIPSSGESIPVVGLGTWRVFAVRDTSDASALAPLLRVLQIFYDAGGRVIDTAPAYGSAEEVTGILSDKLKLNRDLFLATKVSTVGKDASIRQMEASLAKLRRQKLEL